MNHVVTEGGAAEGSRGQEQQQDQEGLCPRERVENLFCRYAFGMLSHPGPAAFDVTSLLKGLEAEPYRTGYGKT